MWYRPEMNDGRTIFVFGSNLAGRHGKGAALDAVTYWGANYGVGEGHCGQSYAIPTKDKDLCALPITAVRKYVNKFIKYAEANDDLKFLVTEVGCGLAGYSATQIAPLFFDCPNNCILPDEFLEILVHRSHAKAKKVKISH